MELDPAISLWRGRAADAALLGVNSCIGKDNSKLVLVTTAEDVREFCSQTRKCLNHWSFRAGSSNALRVAAVRHPQSRLLFGVSGAPGLNASKKARQARRQEANKSAALPANEALTVWRDTDLEVAKWRRSTLNSSAKAFAVLVHPQLTEEALVVFQDGSFAAFDEDLARVFHSDDAKDAAIEEEDDDDEDEEVVWTSLDSDNRNPLKGGLFLSIVLQKTNKKGENSFVLVVYQVVVPTKERSKGGNLGAVLLVRRRVELPDSEELSSCAFHAETFAYSFVGRSGNWKTLRFSRDALTNALTLVTSLQLPSLTSAESDSAMPLHKKRKLQANSTATAGYMTCGVGSFSYLMAVAQDSPTKITGWDAKFAVPVANMEINTAAEKDGDSEVVVGRGNNGGIGKLVQIVSSLNGEAVIVAYERGVFLVHVRNKHSTLASVLGASATTAATAEAPALPNSSVQWETVTTTSSTDGDKLDSETWQSSVCSEDERERQLIADLSDPLVTPTAKEFSGRLDKALKKNKRKADGEGEENISFRLLQAVTRRCLDSADLGVWDPLETMLRSDRLSARAEPTLLPTLMQHNQFALLECAIVHLVDIDERSIVRLVKYFIRKSSDSAFVEYVTKKVKAQNKKAGEVDGSAACERFAVALLGLPTNSVFLHHAIRELELEEVLLLLAICKKLLLALTAGDDAAQDEEEKSKKKSKKPKTTEENSSLALKKDERRFTPLPSASHCCAWICALLDAHLAALVQRASQNAEVSRTLRQLESLVQLQLRASAQYETVQGVLSNFLSGVQLPQAPGLPDYSIEQLHM
ncbi:hypothetical protein PHYBOEH_011880 [Phytophthora boehmeriae]|uniref:Nucleolar protein 11 C-terminal domain-containing protein n=1 Tax=Phytophthora boehmeriae TaxID=109152 RepID=A0A8T1WXM8_9STRA|nr:hypothetical protein PHYBOEH_011880 [Phytophthora boehmeriae]